MHKELLEQQREMEREGNGERKRERELEREQMCSEKHREGEKKRGCGFLLGSLS